MKGDRSASETAATFPKSRVDTSSNQSLVGFAQAGADAFGYTAQLTLDRDVAQLLRLRVAQINNCVYCLSVHYAAAELAEIPDNKVKMLTAWWETGLFTPAERAALAYTERLTRAADATSDQSFQNVHDDLVSHFDEQQVIEIIGVVVNMNVWTRLKLAEGSSPIA